MYSFKWDQNTRGYLLTTQTGKSVASEIRPVFAEELSLTGLDARLAFDPAERRPLLWAKQMEWGFVLGGCRARTCEDSPKNGIGSG